MQSCGVRALAYFVTGAMNTATRGHEEEIMPNQAMSFLWEMVPTRSARWGSAMRL
jgi:hypothetical protein